MSAGRRRILLAAILAIGAVVRVWGIAFGLPHTATRPDEEFVVAVALGFFSGDYNPHLFVWPSLFFYIAHAMARAAYLGGRLFGGHQEVQDFVQSVYADPTWFYVSLRLLSATCGVLTIAVVYSLGRALFNCTAGILAAFFLSLAYLHVRDSHFGVLDVPATLFIMLTVRLLVDAWQRARPRSRFVLAGISAGVGTSIKYNAAAVCILAVVVALLRMRTCAGERPGAAAGHLAAFAAAFGCCVVAASPYAWLDAGTFMEHVRAQGLHFAGGHGTSIANGWLHHLTFSLRYGLGLPLLGAGLAGMVTAIAGNRSAGILLCAFPVVYFGVIGSGQTAFVRYALPLIPFLCLGAGLAVSRLAAAIARDDSGRWRPVVAAAAAMLIVTPSLLSVVRFDRVVSQTDTRVLAAAWLHDRMAPGSTLYESGAPYVRPHFAWRSKRDVLLVEFDAVKNLFTTPGGSLPDWIVAVRESPPRLYLRTPSQVTTLLGSHYELVREFKAARGRESEFWFDRQDAFFLPFADLTLRERPGPELGIYRRVSR